jgi:cation:H+ antiporter
MTGGNRLLIGAAWPAVFFLYWFRTREQVLRLEHGHAIEVIALAAAAVYSFLLAFRRDITLYDAVVLGGIFFVYVYLVSRVPSEEPELVGPSRVIGRLPTIQRRVLIVTLFVYSAAAILSCAEPFADGLVHSGKQLGIDEFLLVQWIAPLASEAPEFLFASILAWRGRAAVGMGVVLSSAVNQWTLLVGGLPIVYALSRGDLTPLPLDARQTTEVLLTAAQCTFAVAVMLSLSMSRFEAGMLLGLFTLQFVLPFESARHAMAGLYLLLTMIIGLRNWRDVGGLLTLARHEQVEPSGSP